MANPKQFKNFVQHKLTVGCNNTDNPVTLTFDSVAGWATTGDWPLRVDDPTLATTEIMLVTAVNVGLNQVTATRAQEGTAAAAFPINSTGGNEFTAQAIADALVRLDNAVSQTLTGPLVVPPAIGVIAAPTSYGSLPVKIAETLLGAPAATIAFSSIPAGFRHLVGRWSTRSDAVAISATLGMRFNTIATATYDGERTIAFAASTSVSESLGATSAPIGQMPASTATAAYFGAGEVKIPNYAGVTANKPYISADMSAFNDTTTNQQLSTSGGKWRTTATAINRIDLITSAGNFVAASLFTLQGEP